jgi:hypothetical protein
MNEIKALPSRRMHFSSQPAHHDFPCRNGMMWNQQPSQVSIQGERCLSLGSPLSPL